MIGAGDPLATNRSTSPTVSAIRRNEPARSARRTSGIARRRSRRASATPIAISIVTLPVSRWARWTAWSTFSSVFAENPLSPRRRPSRAAATNSSRPSIPSSRYTTIAFFGPNPGIAVMARTPDGTCPRSSSSSGNVPVSSTLRTFSAIDFPTFGIARIPASSRSRSSSGNPPTARAAFSYARGLKGSFATIAKRSANSVSTCATSSLERVIPTVPQARSNRTKRRAFWECRRSSA